MNDYDDRSRGWGLFWMYAGMAAVACLPLLVAIIASLP